MRPERLRREFYRTFAARFFLRVHMTLILAGVGLAGLLTSKGLLALGVVTMAVRYLVAVVVGYAVFLGLVHLWLRYVGQDRRSRGARRSRGDWPLDAIDAPTPGPRPSTGEVFRPGGGRFGGGGASESLDDPSRLAEPAAHAAEGAASGLADAGEGLGPLAVLILLVMAAAAALYFIWLSPALLLELAFQLLAGAGLVGAARRLDAPGRTVGVARATLLPFVAIAVVVVAAGWLAQGVCPTATRLAEVLAGCGPAR